MIKDIKCTLSVLDKVSKAGNPYSVIVLNVNGSQIQVGFLSEGVELALLRAGVDVKSNA